jgi:GT2 family glycosyltransferase
MAAVSGLPAKSCSPRIAFVILVFNGFADAARLVRQLLECPDPGLLVIILDNASVDRRGIELCDALLLDGRVKFIMRGVNSGYAVGNNHGIDVARECGIDRVVILNPDLVVDDGRTFVARLHRHFESTEFLCLGLTVRGVMPYFTGPCWPSVLFPLLTRQVFDRVLSRSVDLRMTSFPVGRVHGCAFALRASAFRSARLFDAATFLYCEELVVSLVARALGLQIRQATDIEVEHAGQGATGGRLHGIHGRWMRDSMGLVLMKYFGCPRFIARPLAWFSVAQIELSSVVRQSLKSALAKFRLLLL